MRFMGYNLCTVFFETQGNDLSHWTSLECAHAISENGLTVVGWGINISGDEEAFFATLGSNQLLGDCNRDGVIDFSDISPFITVLASDGYLAEADTNDDGAVTFDDISPFIVLLSL